MTVVNAVVNSGSDTEIRAAVAQVNATGNGGVVLLGPTQFDIHSTIALPSNVSVIGSGWGPTKLISKADVPIFNILGANVNSRVGRVNIAEMIIDGGLFDGVASQRTTPVVAIYYASLCLFDHVKFQNTNGPATKLVSTWDSTFQECRWDTCGSSEGSGLPAHQIFAGDPLATIGQFGRFGNEDTNDTRYFHCVWESFGQGGVWINDDTVNTGLVQTQTFRDCKLDSSNTAFGSFIRATSCNVLNIYNMDCSNNGAGTGFSDVPFDLIKIANSRSVTIDGLDFLLDGGTLGHSPQRSLISFDSTRNPHNFVTGNSTVTLRGIRPQIQTNGRPSLGYLVEFVGSNNNRFTMEHNHQIGSALTNVAMYGGTMPNPDIGSQIGTKAGTPTDALYGDAQVPGLLTNEALGPVLDTSANKVWFRFPDGTWKGVALS